MKRFPIYLQADRMDCGPACLKMIAKHYGKHYRLETLRNKSFITREGVSMLGISDAAESIGFRTSGVIISLRQLANEAPLPCIIHWNQNHFVVLYEVRRKRSKLYFHIADPAIGRIIYNEVEIEKFWCKNTGRGGEKGLVLLLEPNSMFLDIKEDEDKPRWGFNFVLKYLSPYRKQLFQLALGIVVVSIIQLIFPFLTQSLVDVGIRDSNLNFITLILIAQFTLFITKLSVEFMRSWLLLHINTRINISLISDFLAKLMRLPISYFNSKMTGDILLRINDHERIESFLTNNSISSIFSMVSFIIFAIILAYYNIALFIVFFVGNILYILWVIIFMKRRRELDYKQFSQASREQSSLIQMISGMQEIKLNNCEKQKRWQWERIQVKLFKLSIKGLALGQLQQLGTVFFSQSTSIFISFIAARAVVDGEMTLGMMMALIYIIGQLNAPIEHFIGFSQAFQDARISLERLSEVYKIDDECKNSDLKLTKLPENHDIVLTNLSFSYNGANRDFVLENINLTIPEKKVTAIVGSSGSGKTTLIKLLLGFYTPTIGTIKVGGTALEMINPYLWRRKSGSVMQDGFIFSESIANNIAVGADHIDFERLSHSVKVANIQDFIESLPLGYNTKIGMEGNGISQGQKQRILIARAVYKNPDFIFLDEATNALDAYNESSIMGQLNEFYRGKTVIIVAHRLSTIRNADKIVVLGKGKVEEEGTHEQLIKNRSTYYQLVKSQLDISNQSVY